MDVQSDPREGSGGLIEATLRDFAVRAGATCQGHRVVADTADGPLVLAVVESEADNGLSLLGRLTLAAETIGEVGPLEAGDEREAPLACLATAVAKYWICKRGPAQAAEALECVGGNGYVEESVMPRL